MSSMVDKGWTNCSRKSALYIEGVRSFIEFVNQNGGGNTLYSCPCVRCKNEVEAQSLEDNTNNANLAENVENVGDVTVDPAIGVDDNFGIDSGIHNDAGTRKRKKKKNSVYERAKEPLYPSCPKGMKTLYASIKLNHINTRYGFFDNGMTTILELMNELLPKENTFPSKYPEVKKMIQELGMDYITYDACVNECILYWKDCALLVKCHVCQEYRYKKVFNDEKKLTTIAHKTVRHFSLITRLKRFYTEPWIADAMNWHSRAKSDINVMRHPVDSLAWRCADSFSPEFSKEPRNVALGISTDGLNPNGCFGLAHSCWPVILCMYNLAHSLCMKRELSLFTLLISCPKAPALGTLSGCVTHGYFACPTCGEGTVADYLPFTKKICYREHRRWLPVKHKYCYDKTNFDGEVEHGTTRWTLTGQQIQDIVGKIGSKKRKGKQPSLEILKRKRKVDREAEIKGDANAEDEVNDQYSTFTRRSILYDLPNWGSNAIRHMIDTFLCKIGSKKRKGKQPSLASLKRKRKDDREAEIKGDANAEDEVNDQYSTFTRRSILYELPNWGSNAIRHITDVMHMEKNITEHLLNTMM
ncbi:uncharacterized protein LOC113315423 [Papaver somniferum]|uniref:uncharacterized protein LOC113315423 n=1 Tax=Papaver somniferum TaxID=3469 RepID=UPI000E6FE205|nr:uncharacterized protein LOC113315423 [Papaver somniferum]